MKYSLLVAAREFFEHTRTKGFWVSIAMVPLLLYLSIKAPMLLEKFGRETRHFAVYDPSGELTPVIDAAIQADYDKKKGKAFLEWQAEKAAHADAPDFEVPKPLFQRIPLPAEIDVSDATKLREQSKPYLLGETRIQIDGRDEELFALIVLPKDERDVKKKVEYWSTNLTDDDLQDIVTEGLQDELRRRELARGGLPVSTLETINAIEVDLAARDPKKEAGEEEVGIAERMRQWAPIGFVYILFISILTVSQMLLSGMIEEKSNRIVEVLLSSVTPWELMLGKLLGVAAMGITMIGSWFILGWVMLVTAGQGAVVDAVRVALFNPTLLVPFAVYFLLGFLLYASILLALGSLCNTLKDAQNFMAPVTMILVIPVVTMVFVAKDPNGPVAVVLSWIPFFTPFVMMNRAAANPPMFEVIGTMLLLLVSLAITIWLSGRIFRNGILRTGQPPKLLEILKLVKS